MDKEQILKLIEESQLEDSEIKLLLKTKKPSLQKKGIFHDFGDNHIKIGIVSDLHIGSKYFSEEGFYKSVKTFNKEKVDAIYCPGDVLEGMSGRDGHIYELTHVGYTEQINYAVELLSEYEQEFHFILVNHDCVDIDTEVLTKRGWLKFNEISINDIIFSLNIKDNIGRWDNINKIIIKEPEDNLNLFETNHLSLLCTNKHRVLCQVRNNKKRFENFIYLKSKDLKGRIKIPVSVNSGNGVNISDKNLKLIAWILTDGYIYKKGNFIQYIIYQSKDLNPIISLMKENEYKIKKRERDIKEIYGKKLIKKPKPNYEIYLSQGLGKELKEWIIKKVPIPWWLFNLNEKQFDIFIRELIKGDGSIYPMPRKETNFILYGSKEFLSWIQALCHTHNWRASLTEDNRGTYRLNISKHNSTQFDVKDIKKIKYDNLVWCLNVPLSNFLVRRNGKAFFTGNCWAKNKFNMGLNVGDELEKRLNNVHYLGDMEATVNFNNMINMKLTHRGHSAYALCFDENTEILTENGWKLFKDLKESERVATLNLKENLFEWEIPLNIIKEDYNGEMFHFIARSFDLMVTPNHKLLVRIYNKKLEIGRVKKLIYPTKSHRHLSGEFILKEAKELKNISRQYWQMKRGGQFWIGKLIPFIEIPKRLPKKYASNKIKHLGIINIEDISELISWYVTEGSINKKKSSLNICQSYKVNPENHGQIIYLLKRIGFNPKIWGRDLKDININSVELCEWLINECGSGSKFKHLPKWLKDQPKEILEIIFDTMIKGDGWINGNGWGYRSISKQLRDDFTEICHKLGYATTTWKDSISITKDQIYPTLNNNPKIIDYKGKIYCVTTKNKIVLIRRNGRAIWSGNSYSGQKIINSLEGGTKPNIIFNGHIHKSLQMYYRNIWFHESGTLMHQSEFMAMKGSPAHVGFWTSEIKFSKNGIQSIKSEWYPIYKK